MLNVEHTLVSKPGWRARAQAEAKELLERYFPGNNIDVQKAVEKLTLAERADRGDLQDADDGQLKGPDSG